MSGSIPGISFFDADLKRLPATKSGKVDANNPNDPNKFILNIHQSFSSVLNRLFDTSNSDPNNTESNQSSSDPFSALTGNNSSDPFSSLSSSLSPSLNLGSLTGSSSDPLSQISGLDQQISALQQINALNQSSALIGKTITFKDATTGEIKSDLVKKVVIGQSGTPTIVTANDLEINLSQVIEVSSTSVQTTL
jgi:hypothetical protein